MFNTLKVNLNMGIGDWGLGIGDWAQSPIPHPQSPIPNPPSPIPNPQFFKLFYKNDCFKINNANVGITINMKESPKIYTMQ